jgi:hypothetical protein
MLQYFLVHDGYQIIKLNKGITEAQVDVLLGTVFKTEAGKTEGDVKRIYDFKKMGNTANLYKLLLRGGLLEWVVNTSQS